jgi:uncharacterized LabA/DUF88 family protein
MQGASYLFVDGNSLTHALSRIGERYFDGAMPVINWAGLKAHHRKVFYYDAIPVQIYGELDADYNLRSAPKIAELASIERQPGFHVRSGDSIFRKKRGNEQKMVDVQLAVDAMQMAGRGLFNTMALVTGDLDFKPLVNALVELGVEVHLNYPPGETNDNLLAAADRADTINLQSCRNWIDGEFLQIYSLPSAGSNFQNEDYEGASILVEWLEIGYGRCRVHPVAGGFRMISEYEPHNRRTHRLEISSDRQDHLRYYAQDVFGIGIPEI